MQHILYDPTFQETLARLAESRGEPLAQLNEEAATYLGELASAHEPTWEMAAVEVVEYVLGRGYDKTIDVDFGELRELTKLMRQHPVAFVMTHKTYIDMLVLAIVLARHGLPLPFIFAGINMDFMGVGQLGRKVGAIFIRRDIGDNECYKATLRHYIAHLLQQRASFMWALEGTRSRTGKLVWPKMGILKYIREAEIAGGLEVKYIPVSIVYDLIPDVEDMMKEGRGKIKNPENLLWFIQYLRNLGQNYGRIAIRFGQAVDVSNPLLAPIPDAEDDGPETQRDSIPRFAFELMHRINRITPVTTSALICTSLLSKFANGRQGIERDTVHLMQLIENHHPDVLVDRGRPIGESVQAALKLLTHAGLFLQQGNGLNARHVIATEKYLTTNYYANMAAHHFYHQAFIELALLHVVGVPAEQQFRAFWVNIMDLRDAFKFEFFYSAKAEFTNEIETNLAFLAPDWEGALFTGDAAILSLLESQALLVAPVVLFNYVEAYRVVAHGLQLWDANDPFEEGKFLEFCMALGEEMRWLGRIRRIEAVSKPFLQNGIRLAKNRGLQPDPNVPKADAIARFAAELDDIAERINRLQSFTLRLPAPHAGSIPIERAIVPGSKTEDIVAEITADADGPQIAAFFDLDRTLIRGFSAKEFFQERLLSGRMTANEIVAQFSAGLVYAAGNKNFAGMAAIGAKGIQGIDEQVFIDIGEEVYDKHLADDIYPESRALVAAHLAKGHTVVIVSAATPYQVNPIARELGIPTVMCTRMEVKHGKFTGGIIEPACWGEGKAIAAREVADQYGIDLARSYFYTDSAEDMPLLDIVGRPRPCNPDAKLSTVAFQRDWPVYRFNDETPSNMSNVARTALTGGSLIPAIMSGVFTGLKTFSWKEGIYSSMAALGDLGTAMAGITLAVKGEMHLQHRPAVFIFNHQSSADLLIAAKLIRRDALGIAKKELQSTPIIGQMLMASGAIFLDRKNKEKAIEAMQPAVDALRGGTSIIIFPEGTRSYDYTLGAFKKGAFHIAMQAGVPVIPVIIKNAHDAMPRGSTVFKPSVVEVVIKAPIHTHNWERERLDEHVEAVRAVFLRELGQG